MPQLNQIKGPQHASDFITQSLGSGLSQLLNDKVDKMKAAKGLGSLGLSQQEAEGVSNLSPDLQDKILLAYLQRGGGIGNKQNGIGQILGQPTLKEAEKQGYQQEKLGLERERLEESKKQNSIKIHKKQIDSIRDEAKAARDQLKDFSDAQELNESGKLDSPAYYEFLKNSGFDIPALMNPESESYQKIINNQLKNAKTYFGGRISNMEMEQFLKTLPTLSNSPEGRKRIISMLKNQARLKVAYDDALEDIIMENKGILPDNFNTLIQKKIDKKQEKLSKKFRDDLNRPVPKSSGKLATSAATIAGKIIHNIPKALGGAAIGAGAGTALFPGLGTAGGAALGGLAGLAGLSARDLF